MSVPERVGLANLMKQGETAHVMTAMLGNRDHAVIPFFFTQPGGTDWLFALRSLLS